MAPAAAQAAYTAPADVLAAPFPQPEKDVLNGIKATRPLESVKVPQKCASKSQASHIAGQKPAQTPTPTLVDRYIDEPRPLRVAVIGGGIAGVLAGILLPKKVPGIELTIYEKNSDFVSSRLLRLNTLAANVPCKGGTWAENVYPGVRCDIPSHVYQSTFAPKRDWSDQFAPGSEILQYWRSMAQEYDVYRYAKFGHRVEDCAWDGEEGSWALTVRAPGDTPGSAVTKADVVVTATGRFNAWKLPDYPGLSDYQGFLRHSSHYDPSFDPRDKKIAVIGNGASGIQLVANLQLSVARLDHYARQPTWIATSWAGDDRTLEPQPIPKEQKESYRDDEVYLQFRKTLEDKYWRRFEAFFRSSRNGDMRERFAENMRQRLSKKPELIEKLVPDFSPNCRRLTPGPGYLEALTEDNAEYISTPIKRFTPRGIETVDGKEREVDAIFCATGANRDMVPVFPVRSGGKDLRDLWDQDGEFGFPYTYLGVATPGFPNLFFLHGPHGTGPSGTVPHSMETQISYLAKVLRKVSREGIKSITPSRKAADDFVEYSDAFFATTVLSDSCSSWYNGGKPGARVHGLWPGSAAHLTIVRREPRWEDFEYEYLEGSGNRFIWYLGNGWTRKETDSGSDMTPYLGDQRGVDLRDVHESWWSVP